MNISIEEKILANNIDHVIGIDEVGRGCWAGPLYMAGYVYSKTSKIIDNVNDSKKLSVKKRESIASLVPTNDFYIAQRSNKEIDKFGLALSLQNSLKEIIQFFKDKFPSNKIKFLVDGQFSGEWGSDVEFLIKGDSQVYSIALASIIAKVHRDKFMSEQASIFPNYGFENHMGYGTAAHISALSKFGTCELHRMSFKPIQKITDYKDHKRIDR